MRILAIGDVVGTDSVTYLQSVLPAFRRSNAIDVCIINGENSSDGNGITPSSAENLFQSGADVITTGNHAYRRKEMYDYFDDHAFVLRPANYPEGNPGQGYCIIDKGRVLVGVVNVMGTTYMEPLANPFTTMDQVLQELSSCRIVLVDLHAEATSEKRAMGFYLDGKVSAVFGTHTHVQTADEQILPKGTGYITDLGMTGPIQSVLGVKPEIIIGKLKTNLPARFDYEKDSPISMNGCIFEVDDKTGTCLSVERVQLA